jgi:hypothetical protein
LLPAYLLLIMPQLLGIVLVPVLGLWVLLALTSFTLVGRTSSTVIMPGWSPRSAIVVSRVTALPVDPLVGRGMPSSAVLFKTKVVSRGRRGEPNALQHLNDHLLGLFTTKTLVSCDLHQVGHVNGIRGDGGTWDKIK